MNVDDNLKLKPEEKQRLLYELDQVLLGKYSVPWWRNKPDHVIKGLHRDYCLAPIEVKSIGEEPSALKPLLPPSNELALRIVKSDDSWQNDVILIHKDNEEILTKEELAIMYPDLVPEIENRRIK